MYRPLEEELAPALEPAPLGTRLWAGLLDLFSTLLIAALFMAVPLVLGGNSRPFVSIVGAVLIWLVAPLAVVGATHGMRLFGLVLVDARSGARPGLLEVLFRELLGRGMLALAWLGASLLGLTLALFGGADFVFPQGLDLWLELLAVLLLAGAMAGHLGSLARADRRGLADRMANTIVASARAAPLPGEAEAPRRRRLVAFALAQGLLVSVGTAGALASTVVLPEITRRFERGRELDGMRRRFVLDRTSGWKTQALVQRLKEEGLHEEAAEIQRRHLAADKERNRMHEDLLRDSLARNVRDHVVLLRLVDLLEKDGRVDEASATFADWMDGNDRLDMRATYDLWLCRRDLRGDEARALDFAMSWDLERVLQETYAGLYYRDRDLLSARRPALAGAAEKVPGCEALQQALAQVNATLAFSPKP